MSQSGSKDGSSVGFQPAGFFALRTPLLPFDELAKWSDGLEAPSAIGDAARLETAIAADRERLRARLRDALARPEVREALFVASPSLEERLPDWLREPDGKSGQKVERAVIRYFVRMAARPTPFGIFAGGSVGKLNTQTSLVLEPLAAYRRHTRLDMDYLCELTDRLERDSAIREALTYRPNSSLYEAAGRLRYVEARLRDRVRSHHLIVVDPDEYLTATLERARGGASPAALAAGLADADPEITLDEAREYVNELIDSQVLVSELSPSVTGPEPIHGLIATLAENAGAAKVTETLEHVRALLAAVDADEPGVPPARYRAAAESLEALPAKVELARLFQVDMVKPTVQATLGENVVAEVRRGVEVLHRLSPTDGPDRLESFRSAFSERYGDREVPLVEALDEEVGVGFERSSAPTADASPLLEGLLFLGGGNQTLRWTGREAYLLKKLEEALLAGADEIVLSSKDIDWLSAAEPPPLPDAFAVMATLAADSADALAKGDIRVLLKSVWGPPGATLLGRFCHGDEALCRDVEGLLRAEEALEPDAVFAEIVHLPEGRIGNILCRPVLREYDIPFLGRSGAAAERQIPVDDLRVSVVGQRVVLRSARLNREVLPRLTSAHNYSLRSLGVYKFLCALQLQGVAGSLSWTWGPLEAARFLPRVCTGRLVLSRARWLVERRELEELAKAQGPALFEAVQTWRAERKLPRRVVQADADNELLIDFDNVLSVEMFVNLVKDRGQVRLVELFPDPEQLCVRGPEGRFTHEIVVPFVSGRQPTRRARPGRVSADVAERSLPFGSDWLYAKLYTGNATADRVLRDTIGPLTHEALRAGIADRWFFIRYSDPDWHLRVRWHGDSTVLQTELLPRLRQAVHPLLKQGWIWRFQLDTYDRELDRYGGVEGTMLAERLFHADSEAVLAIVELLAGDEGADARWRLTLRGIDALLNDLGFDLDARLGVISRAREGFAREFRADTTYLKHQLGDKFRKQRKELEALLDAERDGDSPLTPGFEILRRRSQDSSPIVAELKEAEQGGRLTLPLAELAPSYVHMHANRLLRSAQRAQELVLYDSLKRIYESMVARSRRGE